MGKFEKKKKQSAAKRLVLILLLLILLIVVGVYLVPSLLYSLSGEAKIETLPAATESLTEDFSSGEEHTKPVIPEVKELEFPLMLDSGKLEVTSLFQFDGFNPDCGDETGKDIASILVKNTSDRHLERAAIVFTSSSGATWNFVLTDLPAGKTVMAFSQENASASPGEVGIDATCDAVFSETASMCEDRVAVSVEGTVITLQNKTAEVIPQLVLYCHSSLGEEYFGGITYTYTVNNLVAQGSATVNAVECTLGIAEVVRIAIPEV